MGKEEEYKLTDEEKQILKMVGTVGAGNAAIALSRMTGSNVSMNVISTTLTRIENLHQAIQTPGEPFILLYSPLTGTFTGTIVVTMPTANAYLLVDLLEKKEQGTTKHLDKTEESMIKETINIMGNSYLTALNNFLRIELFPSIPRIKVITATRGEDIDALLRGGLSALVRGEIGNESQYVLSINASLMTHEKIMGVLTLVAAFKSVKPMIKTVREMTGK